jgi:indolepyruvate ferredoxin oxidoreductase, beta subunit
MSEGGITAQLEQRAAQGLERGWTFDILIVGVGGQGVLTIAEVLAEAALVAGLPVNYYPSKGMAQRGGFVKAQVRIGRGFVGPNIPERGADLSVGLERSEALKAIRFTRPGGEFILYDDVWAPAAVMLGKAPYPAVDEVEAAVRSAGARLYAARAGDLPQYQGQPVPENVFVLGLALGHTHLMEVLEPERVARLLEARWPRAAERNLYGFRAGLEGSTTERLKG